MMKRIAQAMCVVMVIAALPRSTWASGEKATAAEDAKYAALEAASPEAASFEGGDAAGFLLFLVLVAAVVLLIYLIMDHHHSTRSPLDAPDAPAPPPAQFR
ncbi:MAG TPA: hypothetical protein VFC90_04860 [Planctomycetota bacterium]|nr:hypothetical protein [Planctomycetota bacterium]